MGDTLPDVLETARLLLRRWALADVDAVLAYADDPEWARYLRLVPQPYSRTHAERFIARQLLMDRVTQPAWAIVLDGAAIGGVNISLDLEHRRGELGYALARRHWNQGYGTEAAAAVIDAAFTTHADLGRVCAWADARNTASQRVMQKLGMTPEGVLRQHRVEKGEAIDEAWFGLLRSEWEERRERREA